MVDLAADVQKTEELANVLEWFGEEVDFAVPAMEAFPGWDDTIGQDAIAAEGMLPYLDAQLRW